MLIRFDGNKLRYLEFVDNCEKTLKLIKPELKSTLFELIQTKITDNARSLIRNRNFTDFPTLRKYLDEIYLERRTINQWQLELNSCKQGQSESVHSYSSKVENCYIKLVNSLDISIKGEAREACVNLLKSQALSIFINGLTKDLNLLVKSQRPQTLEIAIAVAMNEEQELKSKIEMQRFQNNTSKFCTYCQISGHTNFNCRYKYQKPNPHIRHFNSNQNSKFCNYCKKNGHMINDCRKRQYNENNRNSQQTQSKFNQPNQNQNLQNFNPNSRNFNRNHPQYTNSENQQRNSNVNHLNSTQPQAEAMPRFANMIQAELQ